MHHKPQNNAALPLSVFMIFQAVHAATATSLKHKTETVYYVFHTYLENVYDCDQKETINKYLFM